jgi:hypothetical protein
LSLASPCLAVPRTSASVRAIRMRGMVAPFGRDTGGATGTTRTTGTQAASKHASERSIIVHACAVAGAITKIGRVVGRQTGKQNFRAEPYAFGTVGDLSLQSWTERARFSFL